MNWLFFALLAPIFWALTNIFDKILYERYVKDTIALSVFLGFIDIFVAVALFFVLGIAPVPLQYHLMMFGTGFLYIFLILCYVKALSLEETSRVVAVMQLIPLFVFFGSYLFFDERLTALQYMAFVAIFSGSILISLRREVYKIRLTQAFWFVLLGSIIVAFQQLMFKGLMPHYPSFLHGFYIFYVGIFVGSLSLLLVPSYRRRVWVAFWKTERAGVFLYILNHVVTLAAQLCVMYALTIGPIALVSVMNSLQPLFVLILTLVLSRHWGEYLKEQLNIRTIAYKLVSIFLIMAGVSLLVLAK